MCPPACCSLQSAPGRGVRRFLCNLVVPTPHLCAIRAAATMLHSTSSGTVLLLRSQYRTSPVYNHRNSGINIKMAAGLLVLVVISATLVTLRPRPERQVD
ncbi:hypothetical protein MRX96_004844 [Rhipicephalus microplus]